jgi:hypothetical protein
MVYRVTGSGREPRRGERKEPGKEPGKKPLLRHEKEFCFSLFWMFVWVIGLLVYWFIGLLVIGYWFSGLVGDWFE